MTDEGLCVLVSAGLGQKLTSLTLLGEEVHFHVIVVTVTVISTCNSKVWKCPEVPEVAVTSLYL